MGRMGDPVSLQKTGSRASPKKPSWGTFFSLFLILLMISPKTLVDGQLIGSRGVFTLPEGMEYRDALTRDASRSVGQKPYFPDPASILTGSPPTLP